MDLAQHHIAAAGMAGRITAVAGDFFKDDLPKADVITMGNILHDWNLEKKTVLIEKAYDALPPAELSSPSKMLLTMRGGKTFSDC